MPKLRLTFALGDNPAVQALRDGSIRIEGVDAEFVEARPLVSAYRRMIRDRAFDVCEVAMTTYVIARSFDYPLTAIPIFLQRGFHHGAIVVHQESGITEPRQLEGKKAGVRAYSVTTGVWGRGVLMEEYGLDNDTVRWVVDDEEHVTEMWLPPNVSHAPAGTSIAAMLAAGELQAGFAGDAGVGRIGAPTAGWNAKPEVEPVVYRPLLPDADALAAEWWRRTGIYPIHGVLVLKAQLAVDHPWLPDALADAFQASKAAWLGDLRGRQPEGAQEIRLAGLSRIVGPDPLPYGLEANQPGLDALQRMAVAQRVLRGALKTDDLFAPTNPALFAS
ncbi:ABC transporter substrate-binding protein [Sphingomonas oryzagri]